MSTWYDAGRRIGLHTAIAQLTARKQQLFEIYNASQIERICDIYDIKYHEAEACLDIVQQILEAKVSDMYQGPMANPPKKCPLPRIGSKDWGWEWRPIHERYVSPICKYMLEFDDDGDRYEVYCRVDGRREVVGEGLELRDAKTLAEARARRDWRNEQGER